MTAHLLSEQLSSKNNMSIVLSPFHSSLQGNPVAHISCQVDLESYVAPSLISHLLIARIPGQNVSQACQQSKIRPRIPRISNPPTNADLR